MTVNISRTTSPQRKVPFHAEIVLPDGVDAPWARDLALLWNPAEFAERRCDARVAASSRSLFRMNCLMPVSWR